MSHSGSPPRLFEYRIRYNPGAGHAAQDSYHYYMAESAEQAYEFHLETMRRYHAAAQNMCVERLNPWSCKWEDRSQVLDHETVIENDNI